MGVTIRFVQFLIAFLESDCRVGQRKQVLAPAQRHLQKVEIKQHNLSHRLLANCFTSTGSFPFRLVAFQVGKYKRQFQFRHDTSRILLPKE